MRNLRVVLFIFLIAVLAMGTFTLSPLTTHIEAASSFANSAFQTQWSAGETIAANFWSPLANARDGQQEPYKEATGGSHLVQYFDKGRMELTNGTVTNGLLATELVKGQIQTGDATFQPLSSPAIPVAGDPDNTGPTYAQLATVAKPLFDAGPDHTGAYTQAAVSPSGAIAVSDAAATTASTFAVYDTTTKHNVPKAFADYRAKAGLQTIGYGISEPFMATVKVAGAQEPVMIQVFERRVLTYTASNDPAFQVEMGNIGQHYYKWRYPNGPAATPAAALPVVTAPTAVSPPATNPVPTVPPPAATQVAPVTANYQLVASVSNPSPTQNSRVTVTAKLTNGGTGVAGATMETSWNYKTTTSSCLGGPSAADGTMSCTRDISRATVGYTVYIDVKVTYQGQSYTTRTSFTTQ